MKVGTDGVLVGAWADLTAITQVLDIGTGSGLIALMMAQRLPSTARVHAIDVDEKAILQAKDNFDASPWPSKMEVYHQSIQDFARATDHRFDLIISNPPYIAAGDVHLDEGDVRFEPESALVAGADGLDDIREIVAAAPHHLNAGGWLMLEHGYDQAPAVRDLLQGVGFVEVESRQDLGTHERITLGRLPC